MGITVKARHTRLGLVHDGVMYAPTSELSRVAREAALAYIQHAQECDGEHDPEVLTAVAHELYAFSMRIRFREIMAIERMDPPLFRIPPVRWWRKLVRR